MLSLVAALAAASTASGPPAAAFTPEGFLLVYGPLGMLSLLGLEVARRYVRSLNERAAAAEERAATAEARTAAAVQRESDRADRAEARVADVQRELADLNREVRHDVVPRMTEVTRVMGDAVAELRDRR